jgi:hypothetical protein
MFPSRAVACEPDTVLDVGPHFERLGLTMALESKIQRDIREALGLETDLVLWRNNTGLAREYDSASGQERFIKYGLGVGSADLVGILRRCFATECVGQLFALEVKQPGETARIEQRRWGEVVTWFGGFYAVVDSVKAAREALDRARRGERR